MNKKRSKSSIETCGENQEQNTIFLRDTKQDRQF